MPLAGNHIVVLASNKAVARAVLHDRNLSDAHSTYCVLSTVENNVPLKSLLFLVGII